MNWLQKYLTASAIIVSSLYVSWPMQANGQQSGGFSCDQLFEQARNKKSCVGYQSFLDRCPDDLFASSAQTFVIKNCKADLSDTQIQVAPSQTLLSDQSRSPTTNNSEPKTITTNQTVDFVCPYEEYDGSIKEAPLSKYLSTLRNLNLEKRGDMAIHFPLQTFTSFLRAGCTDVDFLTGYLRAVTEVKLPTENIWGITPGTVSRDLISLGMQRYFLGDTQALPSIIENLNRRKAAGDAVAANALGNLYWPDSLTEDYQEMVSFYVSRDIITKDIESMDTGLNFEPGNDLYELQKKLDRDRKQNLLFAAQNGYAPAHIGLMRFKSIYLIELCDAYPDYSLHRRIWYSDNGEKVVSQLFDWAVTELKKGPTAASTLSAIEGVLISVAHARTNCGYSVHDPSGDFKVSRDGAEWAVYWAVYTPYFTDFSSETKLAFGSMLDWVDINRDHTIEEKHHASANFLLSAGMYYAALGLKPYDSYMNHLRQKISKATIADAQRTLKKYDFYNGKIDGIPGNQFKSAVAAAKQQCTDETADMYPEYCWVGRRAIKVRSSDWFRALMLGDELPRNG